MRGCGFLKISFPRDVQRPRRSILRWRPRDECKQLRSCVWLLGAERSEGPQSGHDTPLASRRLSSLLAVENEYCEPTLGSPRIHGELLKLGIDVGQTTAAKYMARSRRAPSQGWTRTHLSLHKDALIPRAVQTVGRVLAIPILGGLRHQYIRV